MNVLNSLLIVIIASTIKIEIHKKTYDMQAGSFPVCKNNPFLPKEEIVFNHASWSMNNRSSVQVQVSVGYRVEHRHHHLIPHFLSILRPMHNNSLSQKLLTEQIFYFITKQCSSLCLAFFTNTCKFFYFSLEVKHLANREIVALNPQSLKSQRTNAIPKKSKKARQRQNITERYCSRSQCA